MIEIRKKYLLLIDLDDTLIDTSDLYWKTKKKFLELIIKILMKDEYNEKVIIDKLNYNYLSDMFENFDSENIKLVGLDPLRYQKTMLNMFTYLSDLHSLSYSKSTVEKIKKIGENIVKTIPNPIPGSISLLEELKNSSIYKLVLVTRGYEEVQKNKIKHYKLNEYFEDCIIVPHKDSAVYLHIIKQLGYSPEFTAIVGDSIKSEVNPAIELGAKPILYLYNHHSYRWIQEHSEKADSDKYKVVRKLKDIPEILKEYKFR